MSVSALLHALAVVAAVAVTQAAVSAPRPVVERPKYMVAFLSTQLVPAVPKPLLRVPIEPPARNVEAPKPIEAPLVPEPVVARVESKPTPVPPRSDPPPAPAPPRPIAAPVTVGTFQGAMNNSPNPTPGRKSVESVGFDTTPARAPDVKLSGTARVGAFETSTAAARPGTDAPVGAVADAGFGGGAAPISRPNATPRSVSDAGFGTAPPASGPSGAAPRGEVRSGSFDAQPVKSGAAATRVERPVSVDVPLEITFKPTPVYSDEARALKLEGDVVLEVEFSASRMVKVLRVVRGLGHGLDEAATKAAESIRFKPAESHGRPVDFRTTVHIVFRLT